MRAKERKKTNNQFEAPFPCPPPPLSVPPSFFLSIPCAHSSLALSLSLPDSLFNGGLEKKAGTGGFCGSTDGSGDVLA